MVYLKIVQVFSIKIYQNYFREEMNADQCIPTFLPQMMLEDTTN